MNLRDSRQLMPLRYSLTAAGILGGWVLALPLLAVGSGPGPGLGAGNDGSWLRPSPPVIRVTHEAGAEDRPSKLRDTLKALERRKAQPNQPTKGTWRELMRKQEQARQEREQLEAQRKQEQLEAQREQERLEAERKREQLESQREQEALAAQRRLEERQRERNRIWDKLNRFSTATPEEQNRMLLDQIGGR